MKDTMTFQNINQAIGYYVKQRNELGYKLIELKKNYDELTTKINMLKKKVQNEKLRYD